MNQRNKLTANRYHDFCAGHRVVGHENKCSSLHGHNYRVHFFVASNAGLDNVGRVIDFGQIGKILCNWLEENWDHKMLLWEKDPIWEMTGGPEELWKGVTMVPFNPTAENMAKYLVEVIGPKALPAPCVLVRVKIEETRKCSVTYEL